MSSPKTGIVALAAVLALTLCETAAAFTPKDQYNLSVVVGPQFDWGRTRFRHRPRPAGPGRVDRRPPGVGNSHTVGIGSRGGCCRGEAAGLARAARVRPHGVLGAAGAPVRSLMLVGPTTRR